MSDAGERIEDAPTEPARHVYEQRDRAESFGSIADDYDRYRPTYPDSLIVDIAARGEDVLDVGCGTGKASRLMLERGLHVLGVEIDPAMAAVARGHGLEVEVGSFETWDAAGRRFDVVTSAQAWHWVDPVAGAAKAFEVLRPGGSIALFWNVTTFAADLDARIHEIYRAFSPPSHEQQHGGVRGRVELYGEPLADAGFVAVEAREYTWSHRYGASDFTSMISTHSDVHLLPDPDRAGLLDAVGAMIDDEFGGVLTVTYETHTLYARTP